MPVAVCTLFEKDYHYGLATLVNSLGSAGFAGDVVAGYRGALPQWASKATPCLPAGANACSALSLSGEITVHFWPLDTSAHFTNYKPHFMRQVLAEPALQADAVLYLDPDVVLAADWSFVKDWMSCGVALCEDVNSPLMIDHPRRVGWRRHFSQQGIELRYRFPEYVNGGCVGVARRDLAFLEMWELFCDEISSVTGGSAATKVGGGEALTSKGFADCFSVSDQDALNAAIEAEEKVVFSVLPKSAMGFGHGRLVVPHAIGGNKPWRRRYFSEALRGRPPRSVDRAYWAHVGGPAVHAHSRVSRTRARIGLMVGAAVGRLWARS